MRRMPVDNEVDWMFHPTDQTTKKGYKHLCVDSALHTRKAKAALSIYSRDDVQPKTSTRRRDNRRLSTRRPCRTGVGIGTNTGFVGKPDLCSDALRTLADPGILRLQPLLHGFRILLVGPPKRPLGGKSQLFQQAAYRGFAQGNTQMLGNNGLQHLARPQRKLKCVLPWVSQCDGSVHPRHLFGTQFRRSSTPLPGIQTSPATRAVPCQLP